MTRKLILIVIICLLVGVGIGRSQTSTPAYVFGVQAGTTIANCPVVVGLTQFCYVATGAYWSQNGGAYVPMIAASTGPLVTSVNGRTGAVIVTATTTVN